MSATQVKRSSGNHTNNCSARNLCASSWRRKKIISLLLDICVHVAQTGIRARHYVRARVYVWKKTYITAAVRQLLFRVKTERNLKLLKKLLVERKATLHSKCISRTRHADAHVSALRAQCSLNCKYGQNCARMRLCCPFYSVTKRLLFTDSKIKYFNCS